MQQKQYSKFLVIKAYIKKEEIYPTNNLTSHLKAIGKEDQQLPESSGNGRRCDSGSSSPSLHSCRTAHTACNKSRSWAPRTPPLQKDGGWTGRQFRKVEGGPWGPDSSQSDPYKTKQSTCLSCYTPSKPCHFH